MHPDARVAGDADAEVSRHRPLDAGSHAAPGSPRPCCLDLCAPDIRRAPAAFEDRLGGKALLRSALAVDDEHVDAAPARLEREGPPSHDAKLPTRAGGLELRRGVGRDAVPVLVPPYECTLERGEIGGALWARSFEPGARF